jgi:SAM-dependent methyltransferase
MMILSQKTNAQQKTVFQVSPYSVLASFYDRLMSHVNYDGWLDFILRASRVHGFEGKTVVDITCGTGSLGQRLFEKGYDFYGCDGSPAMLGVARKKFGRLARNKRLACADMRALPFKPPADLVFSLYDSMNYLMRPGDWRRCLHQVARLLRPGGLFIFDVSTVANSKEAFSNYRYEDSSKAGHLVRFCRFDDKRMVQYNHFEIQLRSKRQIVFVEEHHQRIRLLSEIDELLREAPLRCLANYAGFTLREGNEQAERVHYILQKP